MFGVTFCELPQEEMSEAAAEDDQAALFKVDRSWLSLSRNDRSDTSGLVRREGADLLRSRGKFSP